MSTDPEPIPDHERFARYARALSRLPTAERSAPMALLDRDRFLANAADMARRAAGSPIRLATKSLRIRRAIELALEQPGFAGLMCFTLPEALWLVDADHRDILVAYPSTDVDAIRRWSASDEARRAIALTVDSTEHLDLIAAALADTTPDEREREDRPPLRLCLDVDTAWEPAGMRALHLGALRSSIRTPAQARALAEAITARPGFRLAGLLAYEGQVAGVPDARGLRGAAVAALKRGSTADLRVRRRQVVDAVRAVVRAAGDELDFINGGGTGSIESTVAEGTVTEIGAGSGLMGPASFDGFRSFENRAAGYFIRPVVRRPGPGVATLAGGGWIASGVPGADRSPTIAWPPGLRFSPQEGAGEVQTPVIGPQASTLALGDPVFLRHAKGGEPAEHVRAVAVYSGDEDAIIDLWPTYRGEDRSF